MKQIPIEKREIKVPDSLENRKKQIISKALDNYKGKLSDLRGKLNFCIDHYIPIKLFADSCNVAENIMKRKINGSLKLYMDEMYVLDSLVKEIVPKLREVSIYISKKQK